MNFKALQGKITKIEEIAVMSRNAEIDGVICHVMGMVRYNDHTLQLLILEYDEVYREKLEAAKIADLTDTPVETPVESITNRIEQRGKRGLRPSLHFTKVEKVYIGDLDLMTCGYYGSICDTKQWGTVALFTQFLLKGWNPAGIDTKDINTMYLTYLKFDGVYDAIPAFDTEAPILFSMHQDSKRQLVELPVTLSVGSEYPDKLLFTDKGGGENHWAQINRVALCDRFSETCPKGMCYAVIEYECEEDITLQFYSKRWLDAEPIYNNNSIGFIMSPDEPTGKLGLKLKAAVIPEPIAPNTTSIEVEMFQYNRMSKSDDIVIY